MDRMHPDASMPHIVQMFPSGVEAKPQNSQLMELTHPQLTADQHAKMSYQQTVTSHQLVLPSSGVDSSRKPQNHLVMSSQPSQLQTLHTMQTQAIHPELHSLPFTSHVLLPQLSAFKQHMVVNEQETYLVPYRNYVKEHIYAGKNEQVQKIEATANVKQNQNQDTTNQPEDQPKTKGKKKRSLVSNPSTWACNVRKMKHQSGEAYVSRRGKYVPERQIKSTKDCLTTCKLKCNKKISDTDRELIFKAFYSLTKNEKKHFLLNTTERHDVRQPRPNSTGKRLYTFKYYFIVRGTRHSVCKNFYLGTLSISQKPVYNVHAGKSEMNIPKPDGRGHASSSGNGLPPTAKDTVREHIMSFNTVDSVPIKQFSRKQQHLQGNLTAVQMYKMYLQECMNNNLYAVKLSMYRKILKQEFNIHFAKPKTELLCAKCKEPINKKKSDNEK